MPVPTADSMLADLPELMQTKDGTQTNYKLMQAIDNGWLAEWRDAVVEGRTQYRRGTATGDYLGNWPDFFSLPPKAGETDAQRRLRLGRHIIKLWGGVTYDGILQAAANLIGTDAGNVGLYENFNPDDASGAYKPACMFLRVGQSVLLNAGIAAADIPAFLAELEGSLEDAAGAGICLHAALFTGVIYDGGYPYDSTGTSYGS